MQSPANSKLNLTVLIAFGALVGVCLGGSLCVELVGIRMVNFIPRQASPPPGDGPPPAARVRMGQPAPDFELESIGGQRASLGDFRGQGVVLHSWTTWCGYRIREMSMIQDHTDRPRDRVVVLAVDQGESRPQVARSVEDNDDPFLFLPDPSSTVGGLVRVNGYPMPYFIDAQGIVPYLAGGMMSARDMQVGLRAAGVNP
ncbi:MAG: TlpA family protein disulfide reductase [Anaerolineales bacterium]|nr:TlpA family protein disulfide reductase [Anaerolineales bacterium]